MTVKSAKGPVCVCGSDDEMRVKKKEEENSIEKKTPSRLPAKYFGLQMKLARATIMVVARILMSASYT